MIKITSRTKFEFIPNPNTHTSETQTDQIDRFLVMTQETQTTPVDNHKATQFDPIQQSQPSSPKPLHSKQFILNQASQDSYPEFDQINEMRTQEEGQSLLKLEALKPLTNEFSQPQAYLKIKKQTSSSNRATNQKDDKPVDPITSPMDITEEEDLSQFVQKMKLKLKNVKGDRKSIKQVQKALDRIRLQKSITTVGSATKKLKAHQSPQVDFTFNKIGDQSQIQKQRSAQTSIMNPQKVAIDFPKPNQIHIKQQEPNEANLQINKATLSMKDDQSQMTSESQNSEPLTSCQQSQTPMTNLSSSSNESDTDSELNRNIQLQIDKIMDLQQQQLMSPQMSLKKNTNPTQRIQSVHRRRHSILYSSQLQQEHENQRWPLRKMKSISIKQTMLEKEVNLLEKQGFQKKQLFFTPKLRFDQVQDHFESDPQLLIEPVELKEKVVKKTFMAQVYQKLQKDHLLNQKQEALDSSYLNLLDNFERTMKTNYSKKNPLSMYWDEHGKQINITIDLIQMVHILTHFMSGHCPMAKILKVQVSSYKKEVVNKNKLVELIDLHPSNFEVKRNSKSLMKIKEWRQLDSFPSEVPMKIPIMTMLMEFTHMQFCSQYLEFWMEDRFRIQNKIRYFRQYVEKQKNKLIESEKHLTNYCLQTDISLNMKLKNNIVFIDLKNGRQLDKLNKNINIFDLKTKAQVYNVYEQIDWRQVEDKTKSLVLKQDKMTHLISNAKQSQINQQLIKLIGTKVSFNLNINLKVFQNIPDECTQTLLIKFRNELRLSAIIMKEKIGIANQALIKHINKQYHRDSFDRHIEYIISHKPVKDNANKEQEIVKIKTLQNFRESAANMVVNKNEQFSFYKNFFSGDIQKVSQHLYFPSDDVIVYSIVKKITNDFNEKFSRGKAMGIKQRVDIKVTETKLKFNKAPRSNSIDLAPSYKFKHGYDSYQLSQDMRGELQNRQNNSMVELRPQRAFNEYQRQNAEDKYNKDHIKRFIQQELDDRSLVVKDSVNFMTKNLQSYIFYEDPDLNVIAKRHCYKVQFIRDSSRRYLMEIFKPINLRKGKLKLNIQKMIKIKEQTQNARQYAKNTITLSNLKKNRHNCHTKKPHKHFFHSKDRIQDMFEATSFRTDESMDNLDAKEVMDLLEIQENPVTQLEASNGGQKQKNQASQVKAQKAILNFMSNSTHPIVHYSKLKRNRDIAENKNKVPERVVTMKSASRSSFDSQQSGQSKSSTKIFSKLFGTKLLDKKPMLYGITTQQEIQEQQSKDAQDNAKKWNMDKLIRREKKKVDIQDFEILKDLQAKIDNLNGQINDPEVKKQFQINILKTVKEQIEEEYNQLVTKLMNERFKKMNKQKERQQREVDLKLKSKALEYYEKTHFAKQQQKQTFDELQDLLNEQEIEDEEDPSDGELELQNEIKLLHELKLHSQQVDEKKAERMKRRMQILNTLHNQKDPASIKKTQVVKFVSNRKNEKELRVAKSIQTQLKKEKFQDCKKRGVSEENIRSPWTQFRHLKLPQVTSTDEEEQQKEEQFQIGGKIIENKLNSIESEKEGKKKLDQERLKRKMFAAVAINNSRLMLEMFQRYQGPFDGMYDEEGNGLLSCAAKYGDSEMVKLLLVRGFDPNNQNNLGNTSLHYAVSANFRKIADLLLQHGAVENIENNDGLTPWQMGLQ